MRKAITNALRRAKASQPTRIQQWIDSQLPKEPSLDGIEVCELDPEKLHLQGVLYRQPR